MHKGDLLADKSKSRQGGQEADLRARWVQGDNALRHCPARPHPCDVPIGAAFNPFLLPAQTHDCLQPSPPLLTGPPIPVEKTKPNQPTKPPRGWRWARPGPCPALEDTSGREGAAWWGCTQWGSRASPQPQRPHLLPGGPRTGTAPAGGGVSAGGQGSRPQGRFHVAKGLPVPGVRKPRDLFLLE